MAEMNEVRLTGKVESIDEVSLKHGKIAKLRLVQEVQQGHEFVENPMEVEAFGSIADDILANAKPGMLVSLSGTIRGRRWNEKIFVNIRVGRIEFVPGQGDAETQEEVSSDAPF